MVCIRCRSCPFSGDSPLECCTRATAATVASQTIRIFAPTPRARRLMRRFRCGRLVECESGPVLLFHRDHRYDTRAAGTSDGILALPSREQGYERAIAGGEEDVARSQGKHAEST